ncbi:MAG TPA: hypothetical protein VKS60_04200, partial [Stellaceae bacterium]|nr:hypothetical protein [Stellaceae bacterium]
SHAAGQVLARERSPTAAAAALAHLAIPIAFYFAFVPRGFNDFLPIYWDPMEKAWGFVTVLGVYNIVFDLLCLCLILYALRLAWRRVVLAPAMRWPLAALALAALVLPNQIGQATWVDARIPSTLALVFVASLDWRGESAIRTIASPVVAALFLARTGFMTLQWWTAQPVFAEFRAAFASIEPGARLLPLNTHYDKLVAGEVPPLAHMDAIAVSEHGAYIPTMLADRPYELLRYVPEHPPLRPDFTAGTPHIEDYDDVLVYGQGEITPPPGTSVVYRGTGFILAKVVHGPAASDGAAATP